MPLGEGRASTGRTRQLVAMDWRSGIDGPLNRLSCDCDSRSISDGESGFEGVVERLCAIFHTIEMILKMDNVK